MCRRRWAIWSAFCTTTTPMPLLVKIGACARTVRDDPPVSGRQWPRRAAPHHVSALRARESCTSRCSTSPTTSSAIAMSTTNAPGGARCRRMGRLAHLLPRGVIEVAGEATATARRSCAQGEPPQTHHGKVRPRRRGGLRCWNRSTRGRLSACPGPQAAGPASPQPTTL